MSGAVAGLSGRIGESKHWKRILPRLCYHLFYLRVYAHELCECHTRISELSFTRDQKIPKSREYRRSQVCPRVRQADTSVPGKHSLLRSPWPPLSLFASVSINITSLQVILPTLTISRSASLCDAHTLEHPAHVRLLSRHPGTSAQNLRRNIHKGQYRSTH